MVDYQIDERVKKDTPSLEEVHQVYQKWINIKDLKRIDMGLIVRIIAKTIGTRVWVIIVGPSGDWKSEQLRALADSQEQETKIIRNFTDKTLVNGNPKVPDLAPSLKNKCIIIQDMAQLLKLNPNIKGEVWAQLRDLYDGFAGKQSGLGKDVEYNDLNVTLIGGSTPAIDSQILIHQDLGTRELIWRTDRAERVKTMQMAWKNENVEDLMRHELREITNNFLKSHNYDEDIEVPEEIEEFIRFQSIRLSYLRAPAEADSDGQLLNDVYPEMPTRVLKQLKRIYIATKSLDNNYPNNDAKEIIKHLVDSSAFMIRKNLLEYLIINDIKDLNTNEISERLKVGYKPIFRELNVLWNLDLVKREMSLEGRGGKPFEFCKWGCNKEHEFINGMFRAINPVALSPEQVQFYQYQECKLCGLKKPEAIDEYGICEICKM